MGIVRPILYTCLMQLGNFHLTYFKLAYRIRRFFFDIITPLHAYFPLVWFYCQRVTLNRQGLVHFAAHNAASSFHIWWWTLLVAYGHLAYH